MNCNVIFTPHKVIFQDRAIGKKIGEGSLTDGLYVIYPEHSIFSTIKSTTYSSHIWHKRMGHPSEKVLQHLKFPLISDFTSCDSCRFSKQHKLPFSRHLSKSDELFGLIHSDIWGNAPVDSRDDFKYFVTFIDDKSRTTWLYLLKSKKEVCAIFLSVLPNG
jgi:GAG-pre-integrase domain